MAGTLLGTLGIGITADMGGLNSGVASAEKKMDGFSGAIKKVGLAIAGAFVAKKIFDFVKDSTEAFIEFEQVAESMFASAGKVLSIQEKDKIISDIKAVSSAYGLAAVEVTKAADAVSDLGVPFEKMEPFLGTASQLAKVLGSDLGAAAPVLAKAIQGLGGDFDKAEELATLFFNVADAGQIDLETLGKSMAKLLPMTQELGIGMDELGAYIVALSQQGVPAKQAMSGIEAALDELSDPATDIYELFSSLAGKTFPEFIEEGGTLQEALALIRDHSDETGSP